MVLSDIKSALIVAAVSSIIQYLSNLALVKGWVKVPILGDSYKEWAEEQVIDTPSTLRVFISTSFSVVLAYLIFKMFLESKIEQGLKK